MVPRGKPFDPTFNTNLALSTPAAQGRLGIGGLGREDKWIGRNGFTGV